MIKFLKLLFLILFFMISIGAVCYLLFDSKFNSRYHIADTKEVFIPRGTGLNQTAQILARDGVIDNAIWFMMFARVKGVEGQFKAGEYAFGGDVSYKTVMDKIVNGEVIVRSITIPEGKALAEIKKIVNDNPYLDGEITLLLKEGEILPETYHFTRGEKRDEVLKKAKKAMDKAITEIYKTKDDTLPIKTPEELLILASIVEKETGVADERAKVASVFVNRLRKGMKLQTDPTVIYAVTNGEMNLNRPLYKRDLAYDSPYNTYLYEGLPPTAICSPGKAALYAAAHPLKTAYLYFVADGVSGGHRFAETLAEHNSNVALYRKSK